MADQPAGRSIEKHERLSRVSTNKNVWPGMEPATHGRNQKHRLRHRSRCIHHGTRAADISRFRIRSSRPRSSAAITYSASGSHAHTAAIAGLFNQSSDPQNDLIRRTVDRRPVCRLPNGICHGKEAKNESLVPTFTATRRRNQLPCKLAPKLITCLVVGKPSEVPRQRNVPPPTTTPAITTRTTPGFESFCRTYTPHSPERDSTRLSTKLIALRVTGP